MCAGGSVYEFIQLIHSSLANLGVPKQLSIDLITNKTCSYVILISYAVDFPHWFQQVKKKIEKIEIKWKKKSTKMISGKN